MGNLGREQKLFSSQVLFHSILQLFHSSDHFCISKNVVPGKSVYCQYGNYSDHRGWPIVSSTFCHHTT